MVLASVLFLVIQPHWQVNKTKNEQMGFWTVKETIMETKRSLTNLKKMFAHHTSNKGLYGTYKTQQLLQ